MSSLSIHLARFVSGQKKYRALLLSLLLSLSAGHFCSARPAGVLVTPRSNHTGTLLTDGQLLLAAGYDGLAETASAELYNPATNRWRATGSLNQARYFHAACRLADGRVLVAGGENAGANRLNSAEIYDPATGQWTFTGNMISARALFEMAQLPDGRVLATDGLTSLATGPVSELYDPATGVWSATGSPNLTSRNGTHLTALHDGRVLLAGGGLVETELYDPATGTWSFTGSSSLARSDNIQILLSDGRVLVTGGYMDTPAGLRLLPRTELYDPTTGLWTTTGSLRTRRRDFSADVLPNGHVYASGGTDPDYHVLASVEEYNPSLGLWSYSRNVLAHPRAGHSTVTLLTGDVIIAGGGGGFDGPAEIPEAEMFKPSH